MYVNVYIRHMYNIHIDNVNTAVYYIWLYMYIKRCNYICEYTYIYTIIYEHTQMLEQKQESCQGNPPKKCEWNESFSRSWRSGDSWGSKKNPRVSTGGATCFSLGQLGLFLEHKPTWLSAVLSNPWVPCDWNAVVEPRCPHFCLVQNGKDWPRITRCS